MLYIWIHLKNLEILNLNPDKKNYNWYFLPKYAILASIALIRFTITSIQESGFAGDVVDFVCFGFMKALMIAWLVNIFIHFWLLSDGKLLLLLYRYFNISPYNTELHEAKTLLRVLLIWSGLLLVLPAPLIMFFVPFLFFYLIFSGCFCCSLYRLFFSHHI